MLHGRGRGGRDAAGHEGRRVSVSSVPSRVQLSATPGTVARQAPLSMGLSKQEYWRGLPFPFPGDLPNPGIKPVSPASPALAGGILHH